MASRISLVISATTVPLLLWIALPTTTAGASTSGSLQRKIERKRGQIEARRGREGVLASDVARYSRRINSVQSDITTLQRKQVLVQSDLDAKRSELARIQENLRQERIRRTRLRARLAEARSALAGRLTELYKADKPDVVTVVLESDGFADLLERTEFMQRVSDQDTRTVERVRVAQADATRTAGRLDLLKTRQAQVAGAIETRRDELAAVRGRLVDQRDRFQVARLGRSGLLVSTRQDRRELQGQVAALERENARVVRALRNSARSAGSQAGATDGGSVKAGPVRPGSGGLMWPINGPITSPFGPRWGRLHAGLDIGAPEGTPIRAADSGRVALAGPEGAYGLYTCIQHSNSLSTCYAHQSRIGVSVGQSVERGSVIGAVGNTGRSFGAHLHFETRVNGAPVDPAGYL